MTEIYLTTREVQTILAALRYWQWKPEDRRAVEYKSVCAVNGIDDDSAELLALSEITALCDRLEYEIPLA